MCSNEVNLTYIHPEITLFIDGIRHSAEMIDLSYERLVKNLTEIAHGEAQGIDIHPYVSSVFIDAWSIIDNVDRFRGFCLNFPKKHTTEPPNKTREKLTDVTADFRKIRNNSDHVFQKYQQVISRNTPALGRISWVTLSSDEANTPYLYSLDPGTVSMENYQSLELPKEIQELTPSEEITSNIRLTLADISVEILEVMPHIKERIEQLERNVSDAITQSDFDNVPAASDTLKKFGLKVQRR